MKPISASISAGSSRQRLALTTLAETDEVRGGRAQVPGGELRDLGRGRREPQAGLRRVDVAPLLGNAAEAGRVTGGGHRDGALAGAEKDILRGEAAVIGGAGLQVMAQPAVGQRAPGSRDRQSDLLP